MQWVISTGFLLIVGFAIGWVGWATRSVAIEDICQELTRGVLVVDQDTWVTRVISSMFNHFQQVHCYYRKMNESLYLSVHSFMSGREERRRVADKRSRFTGNGHRACKWNETRRTFSTFRRALKSTLDRARGGRPWFTPFVLLFDDIGALGPQQTCPRV